MQCATFKDSGYELMVCYSEINGEILYASIGGIVLVDRDDQWHFPKMSWLYDIVKFIHRATVCADSREAVIKEHAMFCNYLMERGLWPWAIN